MAWRNEYADSLHKVLIDTPSGTIECVGGSYAGVPFFVEETASSGGREVVTKPLPFSDSHVNEDVGKKVLGITCTIYLTGADCETKRERLEEALNKEGAFEFIHPHYGRMNARCTAYSLSRLNRNSFQAKSRLFRNKMSRSRRKVLRIYADRQ